MIPDFLRNESRAYPFVTVHDEMEAPCAAASVLGSISEFRFPFGRRDLCTDHSHDGPLATPLIPSGVMSS